MGWVCVVPAKCRTASATPRHAGALSETRHGGSAPRVHSSSLVLRPRARATSLARDVVFRKQATGSWLVRGPVLRKELIDWHLWTPSPWTLEQPGKIGSPILRRIANRSCRKENRRGRFERERRSHWNALDGNVVLAKRCVDAPIRKPVLKNNTLTSRTELL